MIGCDHEPVYWTLETPLGPERFEGFCPECYRERAEAGHCVECGFENAKPRVLASGLNGEPDMIVPHCSQCWRRMLIPERCEVCGRFAGSAGVYIDLGELPTFYGCDGPEPPEPIGAFVCDREPCRRGAEALGETMHRRHETTAEIGGRMYATALRANL